MSSRPSRRAASSRKLYGEDSREASDANHENSSKGRSSAPVKENGHPNASRQSTRRAHGNAAAAASIPVDEGDDAPTPPQDEVKVDLSVIGVKIRKQFGKYGWFTGTVKRYDGDGIYFVEYEDGDSEHMIMEDIEEYRVVSRGERRERVLANKTDSASSRLKSKKPRTEEGEEEPRKKPARSKSSRSAPVEDENEVSAVTLDYKDVNVQTMTFYPTADASSLNYMHDSLADSLLKALDSTEPEYGENLLTFISEFHNQVPSPHHYKTLVAILLYGPKTHRGVFPCCHRLNTAHKYFETLVMQHGLADVIASSLDSDYWQKVFGQMKSLYYTVERDETRASIAAIRRIGLTLHARAVCMDSFEVLLKQQLRGCLGPVDDNESYKTRPIVRDILSHGQGAKVALETAAKAYVYSWIHYGHLKRGSLRLPAIKGADSDDAMEILELANGSTCRLLRSMGKTLSYLAYLYSKETNEDFQAVAYLIFDIVQKEFSETDFDPSNLVEDDPDKLEIQIKLGIITELDKQVVPQIYPMLADKLGVARQFNIIYGISKNK